MVAGDGRITGTLACSGLSKVWNEGTDREVAALADIDLSVRAGEFLVVIGPSGCGKSTLLKLLAGLEQPTAGRLFHDGQPIAEPHVNRSLIFQQPSLYPWLSARDNVAFGLKLQSVARRERRQRADEFLRQVGLREFAAKHPHELSGGMQQRVAIARALCVGADILLMDEPFAALDPLTRDALGQDYRRLHDALGLTTVMITHDMLEALGLADRIAVLRAGCVIADGSPSAVIAHEDASVRELMQTPRRIAERVSALLATKER
jgi:NitT/TauT family transport system ATP-binding protein